MLPNKSILNLGDWVKGNSKNGELIIGFVETLGLSEGLVRVTVVTSDNKKTIGKTIQMSINFVERLPASNTVHEEQLLFLIDLALSTGDEGWFLELSSKLNSIRQLVVTI